MIRLIKENLDRRYNALLHQRKESNFLLLEMDYVEYIGNNGLIGKIMKNLIKEQKIQKQFLQSIFDLFMMVSTVRQYRTDKEGKDIVIPSFFDKEIEKEYNLLKNFRQMIIDEDKAYQDAKGKANGRKVSEATNFFDFKPSEILNREDDLLHIQQLHNNIMEKLDFYTNEQPAIMKLSFDDERSILYFANAEITISKRAQNDAHELLRTLFKDKAKLWNNDEVLDDWKLDVDKNTPKNKIYQAGKAVNRLVAQETKIKDFLVITTKTVALNKKYLAN